MSGSCPPFSHRETHTEREGEREREREGGREGEREDGMLTMICDRRWHHKLEARESVQKLLALQASLSK